MRENSKRLIHNMLSTFAIMDIPQQIKTVSGVTGHGSAFASSCGFPLFQGSLAMAWLLPAPVTFPCFGGHWPWTLGDKAAEVTHFRFGGQ